MTIYFTIFTIDTCAGNSRSCVTTTIAVEWCNTAFPKPMFRGTLGFRGDHSKVLRKLLAYLRKE